MSIDKFYDHSKLVSRRLTDKWLIKNNLYDWLYTETKNLHQDSTLRFRLYCIENDIKDQPKCICGKEVFLNYDKSPVSLRKYCSSKCATKDRDPEVFKKIDFVAANEKRARTNLEKYGKAYNSQREEVKEIISRVQTERQRLKKKLL